MNITKHILIAFIFIIFVLSIQDGVLAVEKARKVDSFGYQKDEKHDYDPHGWIIPDTDVKTFVMLNPYYGKDKNQIYRCITNQSCGGLWADVAHQSDLSSFKILSRTSPLAKDKNYVYTLFSTIEWADPATFELTKTGAKDKNYTYDAQGKMIWSRKSWQREAKYKIAGFDLNNIKKIYPAFEIYQYPLTDISRFKWDYRCNQIYALDATLIRSLNGGVVSVTIYKDLKNTPSWQYGSWDIRFVNETRLNLLVPKLKQYKKTIDNTKTSDWSGEVLNINIDKECSIRPEEKAYHQRKIKNAQWKTVGMGYYSLTKINDYYDIFYNIVSLSKDGNNWMEITYNLTRNINNDRVDNSDYIEKVIIKDKIIQKNINTLQNILIQ